MKYFIANWKAHKTLDESIQWIETFKKNIAPISDLLLNNEIKIIICPSTPFIFQVKQQIGEIQGVSIGLQDISQFPTGSFTGEVPAGILNRSIEYTLIGHSERRTLLGETDTVIIEKYSHAVASNLTPIFCISKVTDAIPEDVSFLAYEPVDAIGTGNNEDPNSLMENYRKLNLKQSTHFFYGGSVSAQNIKHYSSVKEIAGFLVGTASLEVDQFIQLIQSSF